MATAQVKRLSRRAVRKYRLLGALASLLALGALTLFASPALKDSRRLLANIELEISDGNPPPSSRRSLARGGQQSSLLNSSGNSTLATDQSAPLIPIIQVPHLVQQVEAQNMTEDAAAQTAPLYSSVNSFTRYPLDNVNVELGKGYVHRHVCCFALKLNIQCRHKFLPSKCEEVMQFLLA